MTAPHKATERRRRFASVAFCGDQMYAICGEGRLWYNSYNPGGCPWVEFSALPEIEDPAGPADHSRGATEMVATDEEREVVPVLWVQKKPGPGCNASVIAWLPSVGDLPIGEHILYAFPGASQPRQEDLLTQPAPLSSSIEAGIDRFGEWLAREMPPGTVIGDPLNWAPRIAIAVLNACQEVEPTPPPAPVTPGCGSTSKAVGFAAAPLLWVLWHHLGASSPVGQPIRRYLGMGQHDRMTPEGIEAAKRWARESMGVQDYLDSIPAYSSAAPEPTPPPAPTGGLVESVKAAAMREDWLNNELDQSACDDDDDPTYRYTSAAIDSGHDVCNCQARAAIHAVADWLQQRSNTIANGSQWAEMLRTEADR